MSEVGVVPTAFVKGGEMVFTFECKIDDDEQGAGLASTLRDLADIFDNRNPVSICVGKMGGGNFRVAKESPRQVLRELAECVHANNPRVNDLVEKALKVSRFE